FHLSSQRIRTSRMASLSRAIAIAAEAHQNQLDKSGKAYILHPLRMMFKMTTDEEMMTAILHDVVEDSDWTIEALRAEGFSESVLQAVECLTSRDGETYEQFIARVKENPIAVKVKIADLEDNMDMKRLSQFSDKDIERFKKYHRHWRELKVFNE